MGTISSQITSLMIVYSNVYSDADQRKHHSPAPLAFVWGIYRGPVNSPHKWPVTRKMFPFGDVIMVIKRFERKIGICRENLGGLAFDNNNQFYEKIQWGTVITRSIFSKPSQSIPHNSHVRARYGMSIVSSKYELHSVSACPTVLYVMSRYIGPRYNCLNHLSTRKCIGLNISDVETLHWMGQKTYGNHYCCCLKDYRQFP